MGLFFSMLVPFIIIKVRFDKRKMLVPRVVARLGSGWVIEKVKKVVFWGEGIKRLIGIAAIVLLYGFRAYLALYLLFRQCAKNCIAFFSFIYLVLTDRKL